jgi:hypothetical protein
MVGITVGPFITTDPMYNYSYSWNLENTTLIITPKESLLDNTRYTIVINASAMDEAGNTLGKDFELTFETGEAVNWTMWILLIIACLLLVAMLATAYYIRRGGKGSKEEGDEFELKEEKGPARPEDEAQELDEDLLDDETEEQQDENVDATPLKGKMRNGE